LIADPCVQLDAAAVAVFSANAMLPPRPLQLLPQQRDQGRQLAN